MTNLKKFLSVVGITVVAGCGSSGGGSGSHALAGTWRSATIAKDGTTAVACPGNLVVGGTTINNCGANDTIALNADLSFTQTNTGGSSSGTYAVSGNTVTLTVTSKGGIVQSPPKVQAAHFSITGSTLTVRSLVSGTTTENGETLTLSSTADITPTISGSYQMASLQQDGGSVVTCPGSLIVGGTAIDNCGATDTISLTTGGVFTQTKSSGTNSGTYTVAGNTITITITVKNGVTLGTPQVQGGHFTFNAATVTIRPFNDGTTVESGETLTLTRTS